MLRFLYVEVTRNTNLCSRAQDNDLKIELNNKYYNENISF